MITEKIPSQKPLSRKAHISVETSSGIVHSVLFKSWSTGVWWSRYFAYDSLKLILLCMLLHRWVMCPWASYFDLYTICCRLFCFSWYEIKLNDLIGIYSTINRYLKLNLLNPLKDLWSVSYSSEVSNLIDHITL